MWRLIFSFCLFTTHARLNTSKQLFKARNPYSRLRIVATYGFSAFEYHAEMHTHPYVRIRPSQGRYLLPCSPRKNGLVPLFPKNKILIFLCSLFSKIACVPLFPLFLGLCSPVPLKKKMPLFPWEGLKDTLPIYIWIPIFSVFTPAYASAYLDS